MAVQVSTEAAKLSQGLPFHTFYVKLTICFSAKNSYYNSAMVPMSGSRYESKFILPVGVTSVVTLLLVVVVVSIGCAVIFKIKNHKGKTGRKLVILIHF